MHVLCIQKSVFSTPLAAQEGAKETPAETPPTWTLLLIMATVEQLLHSQ